MSIASGAGSSGAESCGGRHAWRDEFKQVEEDPLVLIGGDLVSGIIVALSW